MELWRAMRRTGHDRCLALAMAATDSAAFRQLFLLDPDVVFLNYGAHGLCPRPVFEEYKRWQLELERRPVEFLERRYAEPVDAAKARLADSLL